MVICCNQEFHTWLYFDNHLKGTHFVRNQLRDGQASYVCPFPTKDDGRPCESSSSSISAFRLHLREYHTNDVEYRNVTNEYVLLARRNLIEQVLPEQLPLPAEPDNLEDLDNLEFNDRAEMNYDLEQDNLEQDQIPNTPSLQNPLPELRELNPEQEISIKLIKFRSKKSNILINKIPC